MPAQLHELFKVFLVLPNKFPLTLFPVLVINELHTEILNYIKY